VSSNILYNFSFSFNDQIKIFYFYLVYFLSVIVRKIIYFIFFKMLSMKVEKLWQEQLQIIATFFTFVGHKFCSIFDLMLQEFKLKLLQIWENGAMPAPAGQCHFIVHKSVLCVHSRCMDWQKQGTCFLGSQATVQTGWPQLWDKSWIIMRSEVSDICTINPRILKETHLKVRCS